MAYLTLFKQWELVEYIANKDYQGNVIEPDRFAQLVKVVNMDLFKVKMGLPEDFKIGMPLSRQYLDANQTFTDETKFLKERVPAQVVTTGVIAYPSDYFRFDAMTYGYQRNIDGTPTVIPKIVNMLTVADYSDRAGNYTKQPTIKNPVCVTRNDGIYVYPITIVAVDFNYIKYPVEPVFAYNQEAGYITEDAGGSTQYEWPEILLMDLTRRILSYIGINLREKELQQYAEVHKAMGD
jgi:hypothetical protein